MFDTKEKENKNETKRRQTAKWHTINPNIKTFTLNINVLRLK